jgi:hypothetical protein
MALTQPTRPSIGALCTIILLALTMNADAVLLNLDQYSFSPAAPTITFGEYPVNTQNPTYSFNNTPLIGDITVRFGGVFEGQQATSGFPVTIDPHNPSSPLRLDADGPSVSIKNDSASNSNPVLSGHPTFNGPISVAFSKPVASVGLKGGYFDTVGSTTIEAYDSSGRSLGSITNSVTGFEFYGLTTDTGRNEISGISFFITGDEPAGFAIDNLTFGGLSVTAPPKPTKPDARFQYVMGIEPTVQWQPLEFGARLNLKVPLTPGFSYEPTFYWPNDPFVATGSIEYSFATNNRFIGNVLNGIAPIEWNLVDVDAVLGIDGGLSAKAGVTLADSTSYASVALDAQLGVDVYASVNLDGSWRDIPLLGSIIPDSAKVELPVAGVPLFGPFPVVKVPTGHNFDYVELKELLASATGLTVPEIKGTISFQGINLTFDDTKKEVFAGLKAEAVVFAETNANIGLHAYFREDNESAKATLSQLLNADSILLNPGNTNISPTGNVTFNDNGTVRLQTGSPVWMTSAMFLQNQSDVLLFDAQFTDPSLGYGWLSVYFDGQSVAVIDQLDAGAYVQTYAFALPFVANVGEHTLAFRFDPLEMMAASVDISNVSFVYLGITSAVPEPLTAATMILGLVIVVGASARRHRAA